MRTYTPSVRGAATRFVAAMVVAGQVVTATRAEAAGMAESRSTLEVQTEALQALRQEGRRTADVTEGLLAFVLDREHAEELRVQAIKALTDVGLQGVEQAQGLFGLLEDPTEDREVRWAVLAAFGEEGMWLETLRPALVGVLQDRAADGVLRRQALYCLRDQWGADGVAEACWKVLGDSQDSLELRAAILERVRAVQTADPNGLEILGQLAAGASEPVRLRSVAAQVLGSLRSAGSQAAPHLLGVVQDPQAPEALRLESLTAIANMGLPSSATSDLVALVAQVDAPFALRKAIAGLPELYGKGLPGAVGDWLALVRDLGQPIEVRRLAARSIARDAPKDVDALEFSMVVLGETAEDLEVRQAAGEYLRRLGRDAGPAQEATLRVLSDPAQPVPIRDAASAILVEIVRGTLGGAGGCSWDDLAARLQRVEAVAGVLEQAALSFPVLQQRLDAVDQVRGALLAERQSRWSQRLLAWIRAHPGAVAVLLLAVVTIAGWRRFEARKRRDREPLRTGEESAKHHVAGKRGPYPDARAVELVEEVLAVDNPDRSGSVTALAALGSQVEAVVPRLMQTLEDPDEETDLRFAALTVLGLVGSVAMPARQAVECLARRSTEPLFVRLKAMEILFGLGYEDLGVLEFFAERLEDAREPLLLRLKAGELLLQVLALPEDLRTRVQGVATSEGPEPLRGLVDRWKA